MKIKTMQRMMIGGFVLTALLLMTFIYGATQYIKGGKFQEDITKVGITTKQIVKDIKEAE